MVSRIHNTMLDGGPEVGDFAASVRNTKEKWIKCDGGAYSRETYAALFEQIGTSFGGGDGATTFNVPDPLGRVLVIAGQGSVAESVAAASVNASTDVITVQTNVDRWITGMKVRATTTGTLPTGLALATDYFVIRISATTIKLASSLANAVAGTAIDITATGSGTHTLTHTLTARAVGDKGGEETHTTTATEIPPHAHPLPVGGAATGAGSFTNFWQGPGPSSGSNTSASTGGGAAHNNMQPYLAIGNLFIYAGV